MGSIYKIFSSNLILFKSKRFQISIFFYFLHSTPNHVSVFFSFSITFDANRHLLNLFVSPPPSSSNRPSEIILNSNFSSLPGSCRTLASSQRTFIILAFPFGQHSLHALFPRNMWGRGTKFSFKHLWLPLLFYEVLFQLLLLFVKITHRIEPIWGTVV